MGKNWNEFTVVIKGYCNYNPGDLVDTIKDKLEDAEIDVVRVEANTAGVDVAAEWRGE